MSNEACTYCGEPRVLLMAAAAHLEDPDGTLAKLNPDKVRMAHDLRLLAADIHRLQSRQPEDTFRVINSHTRAAMIPVGSGLPEGHSEPISTCPGCRLPPGVTPETIEADLIERLAKELKEEIADVTPEDLVQHKKDLDRQIRNLQNERDILG